MKVPSILSNHANYVIAVAASLMLTFVIVGCTASGPFQPHSAFKQAVLPTGYQSVYQNQAGSGSRGSFAPQQGGAQYGNWNPASGYGVTPQTSNRFFGQSAYPQYNQRPGGGLTNPFVGRSYSSGSC